MILFISDNHESKALKILSSSDKTSMVIESDNNLIEQKLVNISLNQYQLIVIMIEGQQGEILCKTLKETNQNIPIILINNQQLFENIAHHLFNEDF